MRHFCYLMLALATAATITSRAYASSPDPDEREYLETRSRLQRAYFEVFALMQALAVISPRKMELFRESQEAWYRYQDAEASFEAFRVIDDETAFRRLYLRICTRLAKERIEFLEDLQKPFPKKAVP